MLFRRFVAVTVLMTAVPCLYRVLRFVGYQAAAGSSCTSVTQKDGNVGAVVNLAHPSNTHTYTYVYYVVGTM